METEQQRIEQRRKHLERARRLAEKRGTPAPVSPANAGTYPSNSTANASVNQHTNTGPQFPSQTSGSHSSRHPSPEFVIPGLALHAERLNAGDVEVLHRAVRVMSPRRGAAIVASAELLLHRGQCSNHLQAVLLAAELLEHETEAVCETLATLLIDGWESGFGTALHAARNL